jgi:uncharacterized protein YifN (PemK superfamily)
MLKKDILKEMVDKTVREVLSERKKDNLDLVIESVVNEQLKNLIKEDDDTKSKKNKKDKKDVNNKKRSVIQWLKQDEVNTAAIRREVEGEPEDQEEEDTKRSYFMKKVNQTYGKDFSDEEVNALYAVKSSLGQ